MMHVNAVDKFINNNLGTIVIVIALLLGVGLIGFKLYDNYEEKQSIDYKNGYANGFKEVNTTRYLIAKQVYDGFSITFLRPPNVVYAEGYVDGYEAGSANQANAMMGYMPHK
jgi:uncharacterized membrane protein YebE (DUF533 family)